MSTFLKNLSTMAINTAFLCVYFNPLCINLTRCGSCSSVVLQTKWRKCAPKIYFDCIMKIPQKLMSMKCAINVNEHVQSPWWPPFIIYTWFRPKNRLDTTNTQTNKRGLDFIFQTEWRYARYGYGKFFCQTLYNSSLTIWFFFASSFSFITMFSRPKPSQFTSIVFRSSVPDFIICLPQ